MKLILKVQPDNKVNQTDFKKEMLRNHAEDRKEKRGIMSDLFFEESPYGQRL